MGRKRALEEKKLVREEARNAERLAMQSFQNKDAVLEVYMKVLFHKLLCYLGSAKHGDL